ncbi:unnamed protein product [Colias eurytheme]|nr:unnamed protein product [Colias eurytheme]
MAKLQKADACASCGALPLREGSGGHFHLTRLRGRRPPVAYSADLLQTNRNTTLSFLYSSSLEDLSRYNTARLFAISSVMAGPVRGGSGRGQVESCATACVRHVGESESGAIRLAFGAQHSPLIAAVGLEIPGQQPLTRPNVLQSPSRPRPLPATLL